MVMDVIMDVDVDMDVELESDFRYDDHLSVCYCQFLLTYFMANVLLYGTLVVTWE